MSESGALVTTGVNTEENPYKPQKGEVAGLDLYGYRQADGSILTGAGTHIPDWPECVYAFGNVFTLEEIHGGSPNGFENAIYV